MKTGKKQTNDSDSTSEISIFYCSSYFTLPSVYLYRILFYVYNETDQLITQSSRNYEVLHCYRKFLSLGLFLGMQKLVLLIVQFDDFGNFYVESSVSHFRNFVNFNLKFSTFRLAIPIFGSSSFS